MRWSALIGGIAVVGLASWAITHSAPLATFLDPPTVGIMVLLPLCFLLQAHGFEGLKIAGRAAASWFSRSGQPPECLADTICVVDSGSVATTKGSLVCVLIGAILMLSHPADTLGEMGPAMAVMLLSYFYGHCINFIFWWPLGRWLKLHVSPNSPAN